MGGKLSFLPPVRFSAFWHHFADNRRLTMQHE
jgi:hypothetical protein